jgi:hypothetical protein
MPRRPRRGALIAMGRLAPGRGDYPLDCRGSEAVDAIVLGFRQVRGLTSASMETLRSRLVQLATMLVTLVELIRQRRFAELTMSEDARKKARAFAHTLTLNLPKS